MQRTLTRDESWAPPSLRHRKQSTVMEYLIKLLLVSEGSKFMHLRERSS